MKFLNLDAYKDPVPEDADEGHFVVGISGGRSSAYQAWHPVEANGGPQPGWLFAFENTGKEREETLEFVDKVDRHLKLGVLWLEYDPTAPTKVKVVNYETAARNGEPFDAFINEIVPKRRDGTAGMRPLPNPVQRSCTATLKTKTLHRYVRRHLGWSMRYYSALGFRADETARYERRVKLDAKKGFDEGGKAAFPMYRAGAKKEDVLGGWAAAPFDLGIDSDMGNCDFCFMKSTWKIKEQMLYEALRYQIHPRPGAEPPPTVLWWMLKEERVYDRAGPWRKDRPTMRALWEQVCLGNMESAVKEGREDRCGSCSD